MMSLPSRTARTLVASLCLLLASAAGIRAQIVYAAMNGGSGINISTGRLYFDLGTGSGPFNGSTASSAFVDSDFQLYNHTPGQPTLEIGTTSESGSLVVTGYIPRVQRFELNELIFAPVDFVLTVTTGSAWLTGGARLYDVGLSEGYFPAGTRGYVGLRFNASTGGNVYGWADVSYNLDETITLYGFAYNATPGGAILAGQTTAIPEPATSAAFLMMLAGLAAFAARRRKRQLPA